jgi:membrane-bound metal-dependent hydrolase YbcI (DUF457 family)
MWEGIEMSVRTYITASLFGGVVGYFIFPIDEPTLMYFFGAVLGVLLPMLPYQNKWMHSLIVYGVSAIVLLIIFPYYLVAGITIGYAVHLLLDLIGEKGTMLFYPFFRKELAVKTRMDGVMTEKVLLLFFYATMSAVGFISLFQKFIAS